MALSRLNELRQDAAKKKKVLENLLQDAKKEKRSLNSDELVKFNKVKTEVETIKENIEAEQYAENELRSQAEKEKPAPKDSFETQSDKVELRKVILSACGHKQDCGLENEVHQELEKRGHKSKIGGILFPTGEVRKKEKRQTESSDLSNLKGYQVIDSSFQDKLYGASVLLPLMDSISAQYGELRLPKSGDDDVSVDLWQEGEDLVTQDLTFSQDVLTPRYIGGFNSLTLQSMKFYNIEGLIRQKLSGALGRVLDNKLLNESDSTDTWRFDGVFNDSSLSADTNANPALLDYEDILSMVETLTLIHVPEANIRFMISPQLQTRMKQVFRWTDAARGGSVVLENGMLGGYPVTVNSNIAEQDESSKKVSKVLYGDFRRALTYVNYGAAELAVDPNYDFRKAIIGLRIVMPFGYKMRDGNAIRVRPNNLHSAS